jgi:predicted DNA-binding protein with PD1-like motif
MQYKKIGMFYVIKIENGEEIIKNLTKFCDYKKIKGGWFFGLGGAKKIEVAYYSPSKKKYQSSIFKNPPYEILNINGNVALFEKKIKVHTHIAFSDKNFKVYGGHLNEAVISPMCEIIFTPIKSLERKMDEETKLSILEFLQNK